MKLREVYKDYGRYKSQADKLKKWIHTQFSKQNQYDKTIAAMGLEDMLVTNSVNVDDWLQQLESEVEIHA